MNRRILHRIIAIQHNTVMHLNNIMISDPFLLLIRHAPSYTPKHKQTNKQTTTTTTTTAVMVGCVLVFVMQSGVAILNVIFSVVTTLPRSTLIVNSLTIRVRRYARRCAGILLLTLLFFFSYPYIVITLSSNV